MSRHGPLVVGRFGVVTSFWVVTRGRLVIVVATSFRGRDLACLNWCRCDTPFPEGPLTTRQPLEYSWMSGNPTPLTKIGQSLLCTGSSTQDTTCPNILQRPHRVHVRVKIATWAHASILIKYISTI